MEVLAATIRSIVSCVCTDINTEKCKYLNNPTKEIEILRNNQSELIARMEDAKTRLQIAEEQGKTSKTILLPRFVTLSRKMLRYLQNLEQVKIDKCWKIEELIAEEEEEMGSNNKTILLPRLERLHLSGLPELNSIWKGEMVCDSLHSVEIVGCDKLKKLPQLCGEDRSPPSALKEIKGSTEWWNTQLFPRLKWLDLSGLPELNSIWKGEMVCDSLQSVEIVGCDKLKKLPQLSGEDRSPPSALKEIKGSTEWWNTLEWHAPFAKNLFQPLFYEK